MDEILIVIPKDFEHSHSGITVYMSGVLSIDEYFPTDEKYWFHWEFDDMDDQELRIYEVNVSPQNSGWSYLPKSYVKAIKNALAERALLGEQ